MQEEKILLNATLCFPIRDGKVLLGLKAKKIGQGRLNGYGGGIDGEETPEQSALRELFEEAKMKASPNSFKKVAIVDFYNTNSDGFSFTCRVHVYFVYQWEGEPQETEEMLEPTWYEKNALPLDGMMLADREWLPIVLAGKKIIAEARYGPFQKTLLEKVKLRYVDSFSNS
jgi:8-oxo-dGTP pyrophosphatase MutT (NUDIX family)